MFRFSIREMMLVMLVAAVGVGWAVERERFEAAIRDAKEAKQETASAEEEALSWRRTSKRLNDDRESIEKQLGNHGFVIWQSFGGGPRVYAGPKP
jgi:hypothetical protein